MTTKYIITGGPGTGKTSIIKELVKQGFHCVNENAREIISQEASSKQNPLSLNKNIENENKIAEIRTRNYLNTPKDTICFFDRSIIDCVAYLELKNLKCTPQILQNIKKCTFNSKIFFTPIWREIYQNDNERIETIEQAKEIENLILITYKNFGYEPILIPKTSIQRRVDFIISKI